MAPNFPRGTKKGPQNPASGWWAEDAEIAATAGIIASKNLDDLTRKAAVFLGQLDDGRYVGLTDDRHLLTIAGSRAGKGTSLIIPNLALYPGSVLCLDPKGENARETAQRRRAMGQDVYILDPFRVSGEAEQAAYNPLADLDPDGRNFIDDAALIAGSLVPSQSERDPHWDLTARELLKGLILHIRLNRPAAAQHLIELRRVLRDYELLSKETSNMAAQAAKGDNPAREIIAAAANSFAHKPDKERDSVLSTALRHTEFLDSPAMSHVLQGGMKGGASKILPSLRRLRAARRDPAEKPVTIYLCLPASRMPTHASWMRLVINLALALLEDDAQNQTEGERDRPAVLFIMDEFSSLGHLASIAIAAGLMAGFGVKLWPFLQDISQLEHHYEKTWETFIGNAGAHLFFGNTDTKTLEHVSGRLGRVSITKAGSSKTLPKNFLDDAGRMTLSLNTETVPLLTPDELQRIFARQPAPVPDYMLLLLPHALPAALRKVPYFKDRNLAALLKKDPRKGHEQANIHKDDLRRKWFPS